MENNNTNNETRHETPTQRAEREEREAEEMRVRFAHNREAECRERRERGYGRF